MANHKLTNDEVIKRIKEQYGNKIDTSKVDYQGIRQKITLICPKHGEYSKRASDVFKGKGECPKCKRNMLTLDEFKFKANQTYHGKYDLSKVSFKSTHDKITLICPEHGEFVKEVREFLNGQGCPKCTGRNKTVDDVIKDFTNTHRDKYDYSMITEYRNNRQKLPIMCHEKDADGNEHGIFYQDYTTHKKGHGCQKCALEKRYGKKRKNNVNNKKGAL